MKQKTLLLFVCILFCSPICLGQYLYDIKFPGLERDQLCQRCTRTFSQKPKEVGFSIQRDGSNNLFFEVNSKQWFYQLFKNPGDGIAIDIVLKDRYDCSIGVMEKRQIKGEIIRPVYSKELHEGLSAFEEDKFRVQIGKLSKNYKGKEVEFNILFLNDKYLCQYYRIFDLKSYQWDLLDMGMYLDSLTYNTKVIDSQDNGSYTLKYKTLKFKIPFEHNKSEYSQEDIKPLYDSLNLTDFNIKKINIRAYASVEGSLERNIELQNQRAKSIVTALQTFQKPTIITEVFTSENWVEFLNDISTTPYHHFKNLSKSEIKNNLRGTTVAELEPSLKNHRKAVITLDLEKKDRYKEMSANALLGLFNQSIGDERIAEAVEIQNSIFEKLKGKQEDPIILEKMDIPEQRKYSQFFNKNWAIRYLLDEAYLLIAYNELKYLEKLAPEDGKVKYNLAALKFKIWKHNIKPIDEEEFKKEIDALAKYGIPQPLINRMFVNFNIIKSEIFMSNGDYINKDKSVAYIHANYKNIPLTDLDYLSLAQYLSFYSNYGKAIELLKDKAKSIDIDEDLLFYYLNLTLVDEQLTKSSDYRTIMLNAINMNQERFCQLFDPFGEGGVAFQLLDNEYLRETYCENCNK